MIHINTENISKFTDVLTNSVLYSINEFNKYFDADTIFDILSKITNNSCSDDISNILRNNVRKYLNMDGIIIDDDIDMSYYILNTCTQYLKGKI